jgi:hypothetical protein
MSKLDQSITRSPRLRLRWLRDQSARPRATWEHIRITGQLGGYDDPERARRTGARF